MKQASCTIYVKAYTRKTMQAVSRVTLKDIAYIAAPMPLKGKIEEICIFLVPDENKNARYIVTMIDVINTIWRHYPEVDIESLGDADIIIEYRKKKPVHHDKWEWAKVMGVCFVILAGSTVAVMTYNTDAALRKTFTVLNQIFTGRNTAQPYILSISYSLGMTLGVLLFFNHIGTKRITDDPTPMEVEMKNYEQDIEACEIETITDKRRGES